MSNWKASNYASGGELRARVGLQFFAEGEDGGADLSADMDANFDSDFESALLGSDLESQQTAEQQTGEGAGGELESQQGAEQPESAIQEEQQPEDHHDEAQLVAPVMMTYNGRQIMLPGDAVSALSGALGMNPVELLEKGMNYDRKAERELRMLDRYAEASGMTRAQYMERLEAQQNRMELQAEVEKCRGEFPDTPDVALQAIAEGRVAARRYAAQQERAARQQQITAVQQRAQQAVAEAHERAERMAWDAYGEFTGIQDKHDVPPRVVELVQQGASPMEAHWRYQAEQAAAQNTIAAKNDQNRKQAAGSLSGAAEESGFEADFASAFKF
ncbi:MAG: hypothetical protein ACLTWR_08910 [Agathobaculum desmolans]|uniref:hypothetical protein n=1 Tax=Agathobaculum desmolans TaxID=39484 RepID=UPI003992D8F7